MTPLRATNNPYPGLRPFHTREEPYYFGRDLVLRRLEQLAQLSPLTVLFARSGMGKSSFLTCKLLPRIASAGAVSYLNEWGAAPPDQLVESQLSLLDKQTTRQVPLLVLDQFEDVFKTKEDLAPLWRRLAETVHADQRRARVLVSIREEWLGAWWEVNDEIAGATSSMMRLGPLTNFELTRAIVGPATREGSVIVEDALAPELLTDLRQTNLFGPGEFVQPGLVQLVCRRLWTEAQDQKGAMNRELYRSLGRAERIVHEYIWSLLGTTQRQGGAFVPVDRVLFCGLVRHLSAAAGIKRVVSPKDLARALRMDDLGLAGPAALAKRTNRETLRYLAQQPEHRDAAPPSMLVDWIARVLGAASTDGIDLIKRQSGDPRVGPSAALPSPESRRFELAHDALGDFLQKFAAELELCLQRALRFAYRAMLGAIALILAVLVTLALRSDLAGSNATWSDLATMAGKGLLFAAIYVLSFWGWWQLTLYARRTFRFFVVRRIIGRAVPFPALPTVSPEKTTAPP